MDIKSVEFSAAFLNSLGGSSEGETKSLIDGIALEVSEGPVDPSAPLATDDGVVGRLVVRREDGSTAVFALKSDAY
jgi:hypothetical protein